ncbi:NAD(P)H-dependent oxidoreductase [Aquimarina algiphila]|uniref:NAD(P)H-dependent oxidoreductase n=1 Tax=Aquimarina algiphila TaxID=2047982 RepID=UPI002490F84D|nr:NAD(P)H-dependent oxidoreductase [Aquimarina algiphila]
MHLLKNSKWRYATKLFDTSKKIALENLEKIKEVIQLSTSSYGLQLYRVLIIEDPEIRHQLKSASWGQSQITDASQLFVFCSYTKVQHKHIDDYLELTAKTRQINIDSLQGYGDFMKQKIKEKTKIELHHWTIRQTYLALGNLLNACAELKIDACPMEGFENDKYNKILGLKNKNLNAAVIAAIGYRSKEDKSQYFKKIRKPIDHIFEIL